MRKGERSQGCQRSHPHEYMGETCILRTKLAERDAEIRSLKLKVEKLLRLKNTIERAYRGYGTPEEEIAKVIKKRGKHAL